MTLFATLFFIAICTLCLVDNSSTQTVQLPAMEVLAKLQKVEAVNVENDQLSDDVIRKLRSPFYDDDNYDDYSDGTEARHHQHGQKKKKHHKPLLLELLGSQGGCRGSSCGGGSGWQPQTESHNQGSHGSQGTFASASAGSVGGSPHHGGGQSQANAQSASFSFGPYSATFSVAQASAGNHGDGIRDYYDY